MANYDFKQFDGKLSGAKEWLSKEYRGVRTGRAVPAMLDSVVVSAYGSMMPLKQVASVGVEDARTLRVQPFDTSVLKDIERAIVAANLGLGTATDGATVRVTFPELSAERRGELVKLGKGKLEEARTTVRLARDEAWKDIQEKVRLSALTEDDKYALKDELQKRVDKVNEELEKAFEAKEREMMS
ncbi:ribosome recycling factor [Candidatus Kaiserbacteria bacterium]|nr:ribosome recycling factor [Candidatus Kaiserbacteria bacterium]